jgi:hypothetical protein
MLVRARYKEGYNPGIEVVMDMSIDETDVFHYIMDCEVERNLTITADFAQEILDVLLVAEKDIKEWN